MPTLSTFNLFPSQITLIITVETRTRLQPATTSALKIVPHLSLSMELVAESETDDMDRDPSPSPVSSHPHQTLTRTRIRSQYPVRTHAFHFDGAGNYHPKEWDLSSADDVTTATDGFSWYHVELPKSTLKLAASAQSLITVLCPPLKLQDILTLASNGPFCGNVNGALIFRVNSSGPAMSDFTLRIAARVTENSLITVSLGRFPRLGFSPAGKSLLSEVPSVESPMEEEEEEEESRRFVIGEHLLESLLTMNHSDEADGPVPTRVSDLLVHIVDTHVDQVQDIVTKLEMELDAVELELDRGGSTLKKQMLDDRRFPKMHLNLQRLLQVVAHGEQVFPRVKEKCVAKSWFATEDIVVLEELIGRLRRLKENLGFIVNRVTAVQAGLDSWQAEQINRKLYYLSFLSMIFLPLSIVTGVFGMNVGGVPWTGQKDPSQKDGFLNVMLICAAMVFLILLCVAFPYLYSRASAWRRRRAFSRSWSLNRKSLRRSFKSGHQGGDYIRI